MTTEAYDSNKTLIAQISVLSQSAVEQTSQMLSRVYQLVESVDPENGHKLDDIGVKVVDTAQQLLKTAEVKNHCLFIILISASYSCLKHNIIIINIKITVQLLIKT